MVDKRRLNVILTNTLDKEVENFSHYARVSKSAFIAYCIYCQMGEYKKEKASFIREWKNRRDSINIPDDNKGDVYKRFSIMITEDIYKALNDMKEELEKYFVTNISLETVVRNLIRMEIKKSFSKLTATYNEGVVIKNKSLKINRDVDTIYTVLSKKIGMTKTSLINIVLSKYAIEDFFKDK